MNGPEQGRVDMLRQGPCVSAEYIREFYGLPWPLPQDSAVDFETWAGKLARRRTCEGGRSSRYELESFMQQKSVVPKKWMAARLGMTIASLDQLLPRLADIGMRPQRYLVYSDLIAESLSEDIVPNMPGLKFRTFSDHNSFCMRLHADLRKTLGIDLEPLFCATSDRMQEYPRQFAMHFDCITLLPLSVKHQIWLDFRKPMNLAPDRCSRLFFLENLEVLRDFRAGSDDPDELTGYSEFLATEQHA